MLSLLFGSLLVLLSFVLIYSHLRVWKSDQLSQLSEDARSARYAWMRVRRRVQASGMIGLLGLLIALFPLVPANRFAATIYLLALIVLVVWLMLLAIGDALATRVHYGRIREKQWELEAQFASELRASDADPSPANPTDPAS